MLALYSIQAANYILPLIQIPFLVRALGVDNYGVMSFVIAVSLYFVVLVEYGFNLNGTKRIAEEQTDKEKIKTIFWDILWTRLFLATASTLTILLFTSFFGTVIKFKLLYFIILPYIYGFALFPAWFLQGMQEMKYIAYLNIAAKLVTFVLIARLIQQPEDIYIAVGIISGTQLCVGLVGIIFSILKFNLKFRYPKISRIIRELILGKEIFCSRLFVNLYTTTNIVVLGLFSDPVTLGSYSIAEKMLQAVGGLFSPFYQAIFPQISKIYKNSVYEFDRVFNKLNYVTIVACSMLLAISFVSTGLLTRIVVGEPNHDVETIFSILILAILFAPFGTCFTNYFVILKKNEVIVRVVFLTAIVNFFTAIPMIYLFEGFGLAVSVVFVQAVHVILYVRHYKYRIE